MHMWLSLALLPLASASSAVYGDDKGANAAARAAASATAASMRAEAQTKGTGGSAPTPAHDGMVQLACPPLITQATDAGSKFATLDLKPAVATRDGTASLWHVKPHAWTQQVLGSAFPLGRTEVGYLVLSEGATTAAATCTTAVEVVDREPPVLKCPVLDGEVRTLSELAANVTVTDNSGETLSATCESSPQNKQHMFCTAHDSAHNIGTCTLTAALTGLDAWAASVAPSEPMPVNMTLAAITLLSMLACISLLRRSPADMQQLLDTIPEMPGSPFSAAGSPGQSNTPRRSHSNVWENWAPQHTPLNLPPQITPQTVDIVRRSVDRGRLETEVRWLTEQLAATTSRGEENAAHMKNLLDSEHIQLHQAQTDLIEARESMQESMDAKLKSMQESMDAKGAEFQARDEARAAQLAAAMDAHTADHARLAGSAAQAREATEAVLVVHEADKARIFELKSSLTKIQEAHTELQATAEQSSQQATAAQTKVTELTATTSEQQDAFFAEAQEMEVAHSEALTEIRAQLSDVEAKLELSESAYAEQTAEIAELQQSSEALGEQVATLKVDLEGSQAEVAILCTAEAAVRQQLDVAKADAANTKAGMGATEEQAAELQISLYAAEGRVEELAASLDAKETAVQHANEQIASLQRNADETAANETELRFKLSATISQADQKTEQAQVAREAGAATAQAQNEAMQTSLMSAMQDADLARGNEQRAREHLSDGQQQLQKQMEMLEAMSRDVSQLQQDKATAESAAATATAAASTAMAEAQAVIASSSKASIVSTISTQTSPLKARESTGNLISAKLASMQKQAERMREDTINLLGPEPTPRAAIAGFLQATEPQPEPEQALLQANRIVPEKLQVVTPGSGKQAPPKRARIYQATPRVISAPMESPSPPRLVENEAEMLAAKGLGPPADSPPQAGENGNQQPNFFEKNPGLNEAVVSPLLSARRRGAIFGGSVPNSPQATTPSEASDALRDIWRREQNRGPPPVPTEALNSPSSVAIPDTPGDDGMACDRGVPTVLEAHAEMDASSEQTESASSRSSRWGPPKSPEEAEEDKENLDQDLEEVVDEGCWPSEKRMISKTASSSRRTASDGSMNLTQELTWLASPGV